jgi:hypothetical protein
MYADLFQNRLSFDVRQVENGDPSFYSALEITGPGVWPLVGAEAGVHLWCKFHENLLPVVVWVVPRNAQSAKSQVATLVADRNRWLAELSLGRAAESSDPWPIGPLVRIHDERGPTIDFRSGTTLPRLPSVEDRKALLLAGLPLPPEMEV